MLEILYRARWRWARYAYGSARDVPTMLRGLAAEDESIRYAAPAAPAVPFLFELVLDPATDDREDLVLLLVSLAFGYENAVLPFSTTPAETPQHWEGKNERAAYDAVAERVTSLAPLLREEPLRIATAYALAHFPKVAAGTAGDVRRAYDASTDETTRATLLIALAMLSRQSPVKDEVVSFFRRVHGGDGSTILRSSAAAGLVLLGIADGDVVQTISAAIIGGPGGYTDIPWNGGLFDSYLAIVLPLAAKGREETLAATLIDGLAHAPPPAKMAITRALLGVAGPPAGYRALSPLQLRALKAIDEHGEWHRNGDTIVSFALGHAPALPWDRDDFRSFIQAAEASARGETVDWKPRERPRVPKQERPDPYEPVYFVLFAIMMLSYFLLHGPRRWGMPWIGLVCLGVSAVFVWWGRVKNRTNRTDRTSRTNRTSRT